MLKIIIYIEVIDQKASQICGVMLYSEGYTDSVKLARFVRCSEKVIQILYAFLNEKEELILSSLIPLIYKAISLLIVIYGGNK